MMLASITNVEFWAGFFGGFPVWFGCGFFACMGCMSIAADFWSKRTK